MLTRALAGITDDIQNCCDIITQANPLKPTNYRGKPFVLILITRRSSVQIRLPQPDERLDILGYRVFFCIFSRFRSRRKYSDLDGTRQFFLVSISPARNTFAPPRRQRAVDKGGERRANDVNCLISHRSITEIVRSASFL